MRPASELALQRSTLPDSTPTEGPASVQEVLRSPGQPLPDATRVFFEPRLGDHFSRVRVHTDAKAKESAREVNALAYTVGTHLVFGAGQLAFGSDSGRRLLAHELTHVVQQTPATRLQWPLPKGAPTERPAGPAALSTGGSLPWPCAAAPLALQPKAEIGDDGESQEASGETEGGMGEKLLANSSTGYAERARPLKNSYVVR